MSTNEPHGTHTPHKNLRDAPTDWDDDDDSDDEQDTVVTAVRTPTH